MNLTEIHGACQRCKAPMFLNRTMDWYGNSVVTLNCWNGHYQWIKIEDIDMDLDADIKINPVTYIGFFDLK